MLQSATIVTEELADVAAVLSHSTVRLSSGNGGGSGIIWHSNGLIITNAHVINHSRTTVELADGRVFEAVCTNCDAQADLAALKVDATDLPAATIGDSNVLRVGELVLAVGNPFGTVGVTTGIIYAIASKHQRCSWVKADIRLAPGNSGGPLANAHGQVIGVNTVIAGGLAFAVASHAVERFLDRGEEKNRYKLC